MLQWLDLLFDKLENPLISNNSAIPSPILEFLSSSIEIFEICPPEDEELTCYLTLMLLNEGIMIDPSFIRKICSEKDKDIRRIIHYLQMSTRLNISPIIRDEESFTFTKVDILPSYISYKDDSTEIWESFPIPDSLDAALVACDSMSKVDHRVALPYFSVSLLSNQKDMNFELIQDSCFLFPLLNDDLLCPIQTSTRDLAYHLDINKCIAKILQKEIDCETVFLPFYNFPKWPYMQQRLKDTCNLLFWDCSFQVPRCFITEILPWLSVLLRKSQTAGNEVHSSQKGRTRRSKRYIVETNM